MSSRTVNLPSSFRGSRPELSKKCLQLEGGPLERWVLGTFPSRFRSWLVVFYNHSRIRNTETSGQRAQAFKEHTLHYVVRGEYYAGVIGPVRRVNSSHLELKYHVFCQYCARHLDTELLFLLFELFSRSLTGIRRVCVRELCQTLWTFSFIMY